MGIAIWWIVLLGALVGALPVRALGRAELAGVGLLLAFAAWTALGISWSPSSERSVEEAARVLIFVGVLALSLAAQDREALRRTVRSVGAAIAVVGCLALLSRFEPSWFPAQQTGTFLGGTGDRLSYPLNYWNGLAALMAMGIPLVLVIGAESRRLITQALATAALPVMALAAFYTLSRGGAIEIGVGLVVLLTLHPRRLDLLPTLDPRRRRGGPHDRCRTPARCPPEQPRKCGCSQAGGRDARGRSGRLRRSRIDPGGRRPCGPQRSLAPAKGPSRDCGPACRRPGDRRAGGRAGGRAAESPLRRLARLQEPTGRRIRPRTPLERRRVPGGTSSGSPPWTRSRPIPLTGIGPGTFEFWWSREANPARTTSCVTRTTSTSRRWRSSASRGLRCSLSALGAIFVVGLGKLRRSQAYERALLAAALAAAAAFVTAAAIDWVWELTVLPVAFLFSPARSCAPRRDGAAGQ